LNQSHPDSLDTLQSNDNKVEDAPLIYPVYLKSLNIIFLLSIILNPVVLADGNAIIEV